ncbi:MAG: response regulator [Myxococcales bacterium FL481]|nr:MAG: response regulator [Myxococcales bacterium FL481]
MREVLLRIRRLTSVAKAHILVVEDDASVRLLVEKSLTSHGYEVSLVGDGLEGLTALEQRKPDLVIVDIMMPRLDGMTFVKAMKRNADTKPIPVIFLTAKSDPKSMIEGIRVGAKFYVPKPFQIDELISKVEKALG